MKKDMKTETFEQWLMRKFYYMDGKYWDTSTYPATPYSLEQLREKYKTL